MTKAEIVQAILYNSNYKKADVEAIVESFMETVKSAMTSGENVYLRGFGTFALKKRAEKKARNISKNTSLKIPAHMIPAFKPAEEFASEVKLKVKMK